MSTIHENIKILCDEAGIKPGKMCTDLKMSRSFMSDLKAGRKEGITGGTARKIADYFGVSVSRVLVGKEKAPSIGERMVSDDDLIFALWGGAEDMDAADLADVKAYADFLRQKKQMSGK